MPAYNALPRTCRLAGNIDGVTVQLAGRSAGKVTAAQTSPAVSSQGLLKSVGFAAALALNLASAYVEVRDENRRSRRTDYRLG